MGTLLKILILGALLIILLFFAYFFVQKKSVNQQVPQPHSDSSNSIQPETTHPMAIESLRKRNYPISDITIEQTLPSGSNYKKYIASYKSDGLKIYGLLTIPNSEKPENGYPTIVILHGYIPPAQYQTTEGYVASQDGLAKAGFLTFKPDLRGHGRSEGVATGAHFSESYIVDSLHLISALKKYNQVDPEKIGLWGHSNGGEMILRLMVTSKDIKAAVSWAGVVGSFEDMLETYLSKIPFMRQNNPLVEQNGLPSKNPTFWKQIDPYYFLKDFSGPLQLHHGTADDEVPIELSVHLKDELQKTGKEVELYEYPGAGHNFAGQDFNLAMQRTVDFFRKHL